MPDCTVIRTHRHGKKLPNGQWDAPVPGPLLLSAYWHPVLNRHITRLQVVRFAHGGRDAPSPIPDLLEPELLAFTSAAGMMLGGFEEIEGNRYYQGWYVRWE